MNHTKHSQILHAATELLATKPTATLQEIATYSNIGVATLHRHFSSREALLDELALNSISLVTEALSQVTIDPLNAQSSLTQIFEALIPLGNKIYFLETAASVDENPDVVRGEAAIKRPILEAIELWKENGSINANYSGTWILNVMYSLLFVTWKEIHFGNLAKNDAVSQLLETVLSGFGKTN